VSSPITFSGFNNIDFGTVLTALMQQASAPLTALQTQQSNLSGQSTNINTLGTKVSALDDATSALSDLSSLSAFQATSSDSTAVSTAVGSGAAAGHYDVVVNELARAQVTASGSSPDATSTVVASGGTLTIGGVDVQVTGDVTLQQLADQINSTDGIGVTASVVRASANSYRLVLTGQTTGAAGAFTIANGLTGGDGVSFTDTDGNGISGDSPADNAVNATDADAFVNNVEVQSTSNTIANAIPGVTLTLTKKDPNTTVSVDVSTDDTALTTQVTNFVNAYNDLVSFASSQATAAAGGDATSIGRDPLLRSLHNQLRSVISGAYSGGVFGHLSEVGVEFTQTGTLQLNQTVFDSAVADHPDDVKQLFAGTGGAFPAITSTLTDYSESGGILASFQGQLTQQSAALTQQISTMQDRLAIQKQSLQQEFSATDDLISTLQSQSSALTAFTSSLTTSSTGLTTNS